MNSGRPEALEGRAVRRQSEKPGAAVTAAELTVLRGSPDPGAKTGFSGESSGERASPVAAAPEKLGVGKLADALTQAC
jgi:hypothetical protein